MPQLAGFLGGQSCLPLSGCHLLLLPTQQGQFLQHNSILISWHRSHFGSRYTLGCCRHVSLFFCAGSIPAAFTLLQQQGKLCAVTSGLFFCRAPLLAAATVAAQSGPAFSTACPVLNATACWISWWPIVLALIMVSSAGASNAARTIFSAQFNSDLLAP